MRFFTRGYARNTGRVLAFAVLLTYCGCSALKEIGQSASSLSRCTFKLDGIDNFRLGGVLLYGKTKLDMVDATQTLSSFAQGELPASFVLNIAVRNPNTGSGWTTKSTVKLTGLAWTLLIDNVKTVEGDLPQGFVIPATGEQVIVPLWMKLDLLKFFQDSGYDKLVSLAFALGGARGSTSRVTLRAKPTFKTEFGSLTYPDEIDIVDREFRGQ